MAANAAPYHVHVAPPSCSFALPIVPPGATVRDGTSPPDFGADRSMTILTAAKANHYDGPEGCTYLGADYVAGCGLRAPYAFPPYCGKPRRPGSSYCCDHHELTHREPTPAEAAAMRPPRLPGALGILADPGA